MRSNYTEDEIYALVDFYDALSHRRDRLWLLVRYCDLDQAMKTLPWRERAVLVLHGLYGLTTRETAGLVGVHHSTVSRVYKRAIPLLVEAVHEQGQ